jgi:hypothetical protein
MTVRDAIIVAWIVSLCLTAIATAMVGQLVGSRVAHASGVRCVGPPVCGPPPPRDRTYPWRTDNA